MKVSFDFDGTLSRKDVQNFAKSLVNTGYDVWIVTSRFDDESAMKKNWHWIKGQNQNLFSVAEECGIKLNYTTFVMKVIDQLYDGIPTAKIDELTAEQCASLSIQHPDYNTLAGRLIVSNHHKNTAGSFFSVIKKLYQFKDVHHKSYPLVNKYFFEIVDKNKEELDKMIDHERDYLIDYFGFKTLERSYLMKIGGIVIERPQYLWLRVAVAIHGDNMEKVRTTYDLM